MLREGGRFHDREPDAGLIDAVQLVNEALEVDVVISIVVMLVSVSECSAPTSCTLDSTTSTSSLSASPTVLGCFSPVRLALCSLA